MATYYDIYWGKSGGTLTISRTSTSAASNCFTAAQQQSTSTAIPWRTSNNGSDITAIRFVNTPKIASFRPTGDRYLFANLANLKSVNGAVNTPGWAGTYAFVGCSSLETINLDGWTVPDATMIYGSFNGCTSAKTFSMKNASLPSCTRIDFDTYLSTLESIDLTGISCPAVTTLGGMCTSMTSLVTVNLTSANFRSATSVSGMFLGCTALTTVSASGLNLSSITTTANMFSGCVSLLAADFGSVTAGAITSMVSMFRGCSSLVRVDLTGWNVASVTSMYQLFSGCTALTTITGFLSSAKTACTTMQQMFSGCKSLTSLDLSAWNTPALVNVAQMFYECMSLTTLTLYGWTTGTLTNVTSMCYGCALVSTIDARSLDVAGCTELQTMFSGCSSLTSLNASGWTLTACTALSGPFLNCEALVTLDVSGWSTPALTDASSAFAGLTHLTAVDLSSWDFSRCTTMAGMFYGCAALTTVDLSGADTSNCTSFSRAYVNSVEQYRPMFRGCDHLETVELGSGWTTAAARARDDELSMLIYSALELAPALNVDTYVYAATDDVIAQLRAAEVVGTWQRGGEQMLTTFAYRADDGEATQTGLDICIDCTWRTEATTTARVLRVYMKEAEDTDYPTTPTQEITLTGDAGTLTVTLENVGATNYDLRVEFYDGTATYVTFPSVSSDTQLLTLSPTGDLKVIGTLECARQITIGTAVLTESDLQALLALIS